MDYWFIKNTDSDSRMLIICPLCAEWYEIPKSMEELKCYRHCPWCGKPLGIKKEDER